MSDNNGEEEKEEMDFHIERITGDIRMHKYMFRICLIGGQCVGKTSLLATYTENAYKEKYSPTVGIDFRVITLKYKDIIAKVHIWDTAGQEKFKSISINYYRSSNGFIYVYDITDKDSLSNLEFWIKLTKENTDSNVINFLVGNKSDNDEERKVSKEEAKNLAKEKNLFFLETSARNNDNIQKLFYFFLFELIKYYKVNKYQENENLVLKQENSEEISVKRIDENKCKC